MSSARSHCPVSAFAKCLVPFLLALPRITFAQDEPTPTLTINTQIVAVDALVHDPAGTLLLNLDKNAFTLKVDGKPIPIRYFNRDNDLPLTIGLMVDTSESQSVFFDEEALSSENFLTNILTNPQDRALVMRFDSRIILLQKMTQRQTELHNALRQFDYLNHENDKLHNATLLYDAIDTVSKLITGSAPGRRALIILTDGGDNGSHATLNDAIHQAELDGVAIYSVLYTREMIGGQRYPRVSGSGIHASGIDIMQQISKATGGQAFIVGAGTPIAQIFAEIEQDLRSQYRFGFTPPSSPPGKFHSLDLRTSDKHQIIQTRAGYYTPK